MTGQFKIGTLWLSGAAFLSMRTHQVDFFLFFFLACHFNSLKYSEVAISVCFNEGLSHNVKHLVKLLRQCSSVHTF